jgi:hypothetical protein
LALQSEGSFLSAETVLWNDNLALQVFARFEWLVQDAIESLAAEIFRGAHNRWSSGLEQPHGPMHWNPLASAAIAN